MARIMKGTSSGRSSPNAAQKFRPSGSNSETASAAERRRERRHKEQLLETLRDLKVEQGNPDLWMRAASLYMGLGHPERAFQ